MASPGNSEQGPGTERARAGAEGGPWSPGREQKLGVRGTAGAKGAGLALGKSSKAGVVRRGEGAAHGGLTVRRQARVLLGPWVSPHGVGSRRSVEVAQRQDLRSASTGWAGFGARWSREEERPQPPGFSLLLQAESEPTV